MTLRGKSLSAAVLFVMEVAIETIHLSKVYGGKFFRKKVGVRNLDLRVERGEVFGYLGPNGAGKSTTIRLLMDLIRPTAGRASILGFDCRKQSASIRNRVGYLPGDIEFDRHLSGREILTWFANMRRGVAWSWVEELAARLDLDLSRKVRALSKGNRQKLGIVQALMHEPEVLILDEPTTGLDPIVRQEFYALVREGRDRGQTFLLSSHAMEDVQELADRVGILRGGDLVSVERMDTILERAERVLRIHFSIAPRPEMFDGVPGVTRVLLEGKTAEVRIEGSVDPLLRAIVGGRVTQITSEAPDLKNIFLSYYKEDERRVA